MKVSVVVSYCSLDKKFMPALLNQLLIFSDDIIIVHYDKLLNGTPEDVSEVDNFCKIDYNKIHSKCLPFTADNSSRHFHNLARWEGARHIKHDYILFLDADEIPEGEVFRQILNADLLAEYDAVDFNCYWYFRSAQYQAMQTEECGLLIKRSMIKEKLMFTESERWSYRNTPGIKYLPRARIDVPFMHHFSWARTREEMLTKVSAWGHMHDKDWTSLINEEFSRDFNGTDFVHRYSYNKVPDKFLIGI